VKGIYQELNIFAMKALKWKGNHHGSISLHRSCRIRLKQHVTIFLTKTELGLLMSVKVILYFLKSLTFINMLSIR